MSTISADVIVADDRRFELVHLTGIWLIATGVRQFFLVLRTRPRS
jgi:hypothetical protein